MDEDEARLRAIAADPDDDTARLVPADWLTGHDRADRAEFIRVECEAARIGRSSPTYPQLLRRHTWGGRGA